MTSLSLQAFPTADGTGGRHRGRALATAWAPGTCHEARGPWRYLEADAGSGNLRLAGAPWPGSCCRSPNQVRGFGTLCRALLLLYLISLGKAKYRPEV